MKEYKVGDTIYVKGVVKQIDEYDTELPYCVDFVNGTVWIPSDNIIDELPTAEPVKPVLPKEVADEMEKAKQNDLNFYGYLKHSVDRDFKLTWNFTFFVGDTNSKIALLLDAWNNGYTVEKESVSLVYVPGTNNKFLYNKRGDSSTRSAKLETPIVPSPVTSYQTAYGQYKPLYWFTDAEITKFGLQDCEKEEVTDDGMGC